MAIIAPETIEEVRVKADILAVIGDVVSLQRRGSSYTGLCCFHSEKSPSLHVQAQRRHYHCFGCGASGDAISFVMEHEGVSFPDAVRRLAQRFNIEIREVEKPGKTDAHVDRELRADLLKMNALASQYFIEQARQEWPLIKSYVQSRGLSKASIQKFSLGFAPLAWSGLYDRLREQGWSEERILQSGLVRRSSQGKIYDWFRGRFLFPIHAENGRDIIAFGGRSIPGLLPDNEEKRAPKYVNSPETVVYKKSSTFYGFAQARKSIRAEGFVYVVEGYMDVIGLHQVGIENVLAACGTAFTSQHVLRLQHLVKRVHCIFDGDEAGRNAAGKIFPLFCNSGIDGRVIFLPEGEDPDSLAKQYAMKTREFLEQAPSSSLLKAFLQYQLHQEGMESMEKLGAAGKGRLVQTLLELLRQVHNRFERQELAKEAALLLRVSESEFSEEAARQQKGRPISETQKADLSGQEDNTQSETHLAVHNLDNVDQEILRLAMVGKGEMIARIFDDADLCFYLHAETQLFLESFAELYVEHSASSQSSEIQNTAIEDMLLAFGPSWQAHWKSAHQFYEKADMETLQEILFDCKTKLRVRRLQESLQLLDEEIACTQAAEERSLLLQQKILFERRIREAQQSRAAN